jgi:hypothetical protein
MVQVKNARPVFCLLSFLIKDLYRRVYIIIVQLPF